MKVSYIINHKFKDIQEFNILYKKYNISDKEIEFLKFCNTSLKKILNTETLKPSDKTVKANKQKLEYSFNDKLYYLMFAEYKYKTKSKVKLGVVISLFSGLLIRYLSKNIKISSMVKKIRSNGKTSVKDKDLALLYYLKQYII